VQKAEDLLDARFHFFETPILTPTGFLHAVVKSRTTFPLRFALLSSRALVTQACSYCIILSCQTLRSFDRPIFSSTITYFSDRLGRRKCWEHGTGNCRVTGRWPSVYNMSAISAQQSPSLHWQYANGDWRMAGQSSCQHEQPHPAPLVCKFEVPPTVPQLKLGSTALLPGVRASDAVLEPKAFGFVNKASQGKRLHLLLNPQERAMGLANCMRCCLISPRL